MSAGPIGTCIARPRSRGLVVARIPAVTAASPNAASCPARTAGPAGPAEQPGGEGGDPDVTQTHRGRGEEGDGEPPGTDHGRGEDRSEQPVGLARHDRSNGKGSKDDGGEWIHAAGRAAGGARRRRRTARRRRRRTATTRRNGSPPAAHGGQDRGHGRDDDQPCERSPTGAATTAHESWPGRW